MKQSFYFVMTDTFAGELNYCWVHRFEVRSNTLRGALSKLSREVGFNFRFNGLYYKAKNACIGVYEMSEYEIEHHLKNNTDLKIIE